MKTKLIRERLDIFKAKEKNEVIRRLTANKIGFQKEKLETEFWITIEKEKDTREPYDIFIDLLQNYVDLGLIEYYLTSEKQNKLLKLFLEGYDIAGYSIERDKFYYINKINKIFENTNWSIFWTDHNYDLFEFIFVKKPEENVS